MERLDPYVAYLDLNQAREWKSSLSKRQLTSLPEMMALDGEDLQSAPGISTQSLTRRNRS